MELLFLVYVVLGYWAAGVIFFENKVVIPTFGALFMQKMCLGCFLGIIIIPFVNFEDRATPARTFSHTLTAKQQHRHGGQPHL